ncbi:nitrite/sulfite reductase [Candidatus Hodgkinia cicadicola]
MRQRAKRALGALRQLPYLSIDASAAFAAGVIQRLLGRTQESEFRPMRLFNGLYLQLHGYMLRIAVAYAQLSASQLLALAYASCKYDKAYFHITTRQTIQFNWVSLASAAKLVKLLSGVGLSSAHTSGNCVRQITCDPLWGVSLDELTNAIDLVGLLRQQIVLNPLIETLPKKVKLCVHSAHTDRVLGKFNDVGINLINDSAYLILGGGLGRAPAAGLRLLKLRTDMLVRWLLAFLRVYCALASTHKYSLRTKSLVRSLGKRALLRLTSCEFKANANACLLTHASQEIKLKRVANVCWQNTLEFERWYSDCTQAHRMRWARVVFVDNDSKNVPSGDVTSDFAKQLAVLTQRFCLDQVRLTLTQAFVLPWVPVVSVVSVFGVCGQARSRTLLCCPGLDYCTLASARSILLASKLALLDTKLSIRVSGCVNACSQHHVFDVGIIGVLKANIEAYQVFVGGCARAGALAKPIAKAAPARQVIAVVYKYCNLIRLLSKDAFESAYSCYVRAHIHI